MSCLLQPPKGGLLAAMEAHKMAEGDPFPHRPLTLLSGQTELSTLHLWRCALYTQVWQFKMTLGPFQCMQRMLQCSSPQTEGIQSSTWGLPLAWSDLQSTQIFFQVSCHFSMIFNHFCEIPWYFQVFQMYPHFSRFSRSSGNPELLTGMFKGLATTSTDFKK